MDRAERSARGGLVPSATRDTALLRLWRESGLTEEEVEQLAAHGFAEWAGVEEGFDADKFKRLAGERDSERKCQFFEALMAVKARCSGVRPSVFLSTPLPPAQSKSTSTQVTLRHSIRLIRPGSCKEWAEVQLPAHFGSWMGAPASSSDIGASGGGLAGGSGPGSGGSRSRLLEVVASLPGRAAGIFSDGNGMPLRLQTAGADQPAILYNEAVASRQIYIDVLGPLGTLANSWLAAQRFSRSGGSGISDGAAAASGMGPSARVAPGPSGSGAGTGAGPSSGDPAGAAAAASTMPPVTASTAAATAAALPAPAGAPAAAVGSGSRVVSVDWVQQEQVDNRQPSEYQRVAGRISALLFPDYMLQALLAAIGSGGGGGGMQQSSAAATSSRGGGGGGASASGCAAETQRCACILEVKTSAELMKGGQPIPLLEMYGSDEQKAVALVSQVFTYMHASRSPYGILMSHDVMWPCFCPQLLLPSPPPAEQMELLIGSPILGSAQPPGATFRAATMFMMLCGIEFASSAAGGARPGAVRKSGSGRGSGRRKAAGGHKQQRQLTNRAAAAAPALASPTAALAAAAPSAAAAAAAAGQPRVHVGAALYKGCSGVVAAGRVNGRDAVIKFFGPDAEGVEAYEAELGGYQALAPLQGQVLPELLAAGSTATLPTVPQPPGVSEPPEPVADVYYLATARVRGLTLREVAAQRGGIGSDVAAAAERALQQLHAAAVPGGGRFLHGDVRLSNIMLVLDDSDESDESDEYAATERPEPVAEGGGGGGGGGGREQEPGAAAEQVAPAVAGGVGSAHEVRCVVIDLGHSRLDGRAEEQQAELRELRQLLLQRQAD